MVQSDQKACGKDGDHPQGAFIKLGGYAFSTCSIPLMSTLDNHDIHENPNLRVLELELL